MSSIDTGSNRHLTNGLTLDKGSRQRDKKENNNEKDKINKKNVYMEYAHINV